MTPEELKKLDIDLAIIKANNKAFEDKQLGRLLDSELSLLGVKAAEIAGEWNGDEAGDQEDRASVAQEIIDTLVQLQGFLSEMRDLGGDV